jgi:hypothetical protein
VIGYSAEENLGRDELWREILRVAAVSLPPTGQG